MGKTPYLISLLKEKDVDPELRIKMALVLLEG